MISSSLRRVLVSGVKLSRSVGSLSASGRFYGSFQSTTSSGAKCRQDGPSGHHQCWNCEKFLSCIRGKFFCGECEAIQPPPDCVNFFQFFNLPSTYAVDTADLTQRYRNLQRQLHPDKFSSKSSKELSLAEEQSSTINRAYQTLLRPLSRAVYLLELSGVSPEAHMESDFLNDMFELNETIMEANSPEEIRRIADTNAAQIKRLEKQLARDFASGDLDSAKKSVAELKYYVSVEKIIQGKLGLA